MANKHAELLLEAALFYANMGWHVVAQHNPVLVASGPACSCGDEYCTNIGKHPLYDADILPNGVNSATVDADAIRSWVRKWPNANLAIMTGRKSQLVVLDIDPNNGGRRSLEALEAKHGRLPNTVISKSGTGMHFYFAYPADREVPNDARTLGGGVEVKSDGAGITVHPSTHYLGGQYFWVNDPRNTPLAPLPEWIIEALSKPAAEREAAAAAANANASGRALEDFTLKEKTRRCQACVDTEPGAPEGDRGRTLVYRIVSLGLDFALERDDFRPIVMSWADRCTPQLESREVDKALKWAYSNSWLRTRERNGSLPGCKLLHDSAQWTEEVRARQERDEKIWESQINDPEFAVAPPKPAQQPVPKPAPKPLRVVPPPSDADNGSGRDDGRGRKRGNGGGGNGGGGNEGGGGDDGDQDPEPGSTLRYAELADGDLDPSIELTGPDGLAVTELGNGQRIVRDHGTDIRYVPWTERWYVWRPARELAFTGTIPATDLDDEQPNGGKWEDDFREQCFAMAQKTIRSMHQTIRDIKDVDERKAWKSWVKTSENVRSMKAALEHAAHIPPVAAHPEDFDVDDFLVNTPGGIVDIRTMKIMPARKSAMMSKITSVAPVLWTGERPSDFLTEPETFEGCPLWKKFLHDSMANDEEMVNFLQLAAGYTLTGSTAEECVFFLYGLGKNGKSTFMNALQEICSDYAKSVRFDTFLEKKDGNNSTNDLARLAGARMVVAAEPPKNRKIDEATIKQLTSRDKISARFLYSEFFEFRARFTIWLAANHSPDIRGADEGIWRRWRQIPFTVHVAEENRDKDLAEKLKLEYPAILGWMIRGAHKWWHLKDGLPLPDKVKAATEQYRREMDRLEGFLSEHCDREGTFPDGGERKIKVSLLYARYKAWASAAGERPQSQSRFVQAMREHNHDLTPDRYVLGVSLRADAGDGPPEYDF